MERVVHISEIDQHIVKVTMEDKVARNTFSADLINGIEEAFIEIQRNTNYKVVVLTGYENYFCCGGTQEELFRIYRKEIDFNALNFFTLPLECPLPVISAMQGHAIGGGFVFGCYADFIILGRENIYSTNFMKYGFTPGMGGTYIVPFRLGTSLGQEMLYTAENYRGGQLEARGVQLRVVPKTDVLKDAIELARNLAEKPRLSLTTLKQHLTREIRKQLPAIIEQELEMHNITFHQPEVKRRIQSLFGQ